MYDNLEHAMLIVRGNCEICKQRIEKAALAVEGVYAATWNVQTEKLHLGFDPDRTGLEIISEAIAKAGHETELNRVDEKTYSLLPECCKYVRV
jgi:Copper chaperone